MSDAKKLTEGEMELVNIIGWAVQAWGCKSMVYVGATGALFPPQRYMLDRMSKAGYAKAAEAFQDALDAQKAEKPKKRGKKT